MTGEWGDVVAAALLGTDRREPRQPGREVWALRLVAPAAEAEVLAYAAAHRAARRAGGGLGRCDPGPTAPAESSDPAPREVERELRRLLSDGDVPGLNGCLTAVAAGGRALPASTWAPLAGYAATRVGVDRRAFAHALGARGRWFIARNPRWARLSAQVSAAIEEE